MSERKKPSEVAYLGRDWIHPTTLISKDEDELLWVLDTIHACRPLKPVDIHWAYTAGDYSMSWACTPRRMCLPVSRGILWRVVNGWVYISPLEITDPEEIKRREPIFREKLEYYSKNWNKLWGEYLDEIKRYVSELESMNLEIEPPEYGLLVKFDRLWQIYMRVWEIHMDLLYPAQVILLAFRSLCDELIPGIDETTKAKLLAGLGNEFIKSDEQFWLLAETACKLGIANIIKALPPEEALKELRRNKAGIEWLEKVEEVLKIYGNRSYGGPGQNLTECSWRERLDIFLPLISGLIIRIERGEKFRPKEEILREREEEIAKCLDKIPKEEDRKRFMESLKLAELAYTFNEDHNFWIDHTIEELIHLKLAELGKRFMKHGYIEDDHDIFFLTPEEIRMLLYEMIIKENEMRDWNKIDYKPIVAKRKKEYDEMTKWKPPLVLNPEKIPEEIKDPFFILLWGYTAKALKSWAVPIEKPEEIIEIKGYPGSPGVAVGTARVIEDVKYIDQLQTGEILVTRLTTPGWTTVFARTKAVITDIGGVASHAAICAREYGIPAVVGTGHASEIIRTGDIVRVDGNKGIVTILKRA